MNYNFDELVDRRHTDALKLEALQPRWGRTDLLPLWVADMDFKTPPFIMEAIHQRCENGILGYTVCPQSYYQAIIRWVKERYNFEVEQKYITFIPGIVPGIAMALHCFTKPGDKVLIQPPVYHPFRIVTRESGRTVVNNPLRINSEGIYEMDFDNLRQQIAGCSVMILCNPHNPGGRVWTSEELSTVADICHENNVLVISDEIHADLTFSPHQHIPFAMVSERARMNSITFMSPSKAFNMPGMSSSHSIIFNDELREKFNQFLEGNEFNNCHVFSYVTVEAAYSNGTEWLDQVKDYIQKNMDFVEEYLQQNMPRIKTMRPQASYLVFLDCRDLNMGSQKELENFFVDKAHLALNSGTIFGQEGEGFMRLNVATPRSILEKAMEQLQKAYEGLKRS